MKNQNLGTLLNMKLQNVKYVVQNEKGILPMENGATGTVKGVDESILFELFGESKLSDANANLFKQLKRVRVAEPTKAKKEKPKS